MNRLHFVYFVLCARFDATVRRTRFFLALSPLSLSLSLSLSLFLSYDTGTANDAYSFEASEYAQSHGRQQTKREHRAAAVKVTPRWVRANNRLFLPASYWYRHPYRLDLAHLPPPLWRGWGNVGGGGQARQERSLLGALLYARLNHFALY